MNSDILLEAGTNELEVLLFSLPGARYGVNVAKVREVILPNAPTPMPDSHKDIEGVLNLRGAVVPIISLRRHFGMEPNDNPEESRIIVMEFSNVRVGFTVDRVDKIHRISWEDLEPVPEEAVAQGAAFTAVAQIDSELILIVDFESIMMDVSQTDLESDKQDHSSERGSYRVLVAEDSRTMRNLIHSRLEGAGYNVHSVQDGQAAWETLQQHADTDKQFHLLVSDIEMPRMDGLYLTKRIREHDALKKLPVALFSSLITPDNRKKGEMVGADFQISKPNIDQIPDVADQLLNLVHPADSKKIIGQLD